MEADCINRAIHTLLPVYLCYVLGFFFLHSFLSWGLEDALSSFPLPLLFLSHTSFILVSLSEKRDAVSSASTKKYENIMGCFFLLLLFWSWLAGLSNSWASVLSVIQVFCTRALRWPWRGLLCWPWATFRFVCVSQTFPLVSHNDNISGIFTSIKHSFHLLSKASFINAGNNKH